MRANSVGTGRTTAAAAAAGAPVALGAPAPPGNNNAWTNGRGGAGALGLANANGSAAGPTRSTARSSGSSAPGFKSSVVGSSMNTCNFGNPGSSSIPADLTNTGRPNSLSLMTHHPHRHELYSPPPTSMVLSAALLLLDAPYDTAAASSGRVGGEDRGAVGWGQSGAWGGVSTNGTPTPPEEKKSDPDREGGDDRQQPEDEEEDKYVYLLPRRYLQNWVRWAYHQSVPPAEVGRLRLALRMAVELYDLDVALELDDGGGGAADGTAEAGAASGGGGSFDDGSSGDAADGMGALKDGMADLGLDGTWHHGRSSASLASDPGASNGPHRHRNHRRDHHQRQQQQNQQARANANAHAHATIENPGPVDASSLSVLGHPLLLRPNVVVGRIDLLDDNDPTDKAANLAGSLKAAKDRDLPTIPPPPLSLKEGQQSAEEKDQPVEMPLAPTPTPTPPPPTFKRHATTTPLPGQGSGGRFRSSLSTSSNSSRKATAATTTSRSSSFNRKVGCAAVPERFYDLLRATHGVVCDDGGCSPSLSSGQQRQQQPPQSVTFQRPAVQHYDERVLVHHHVFASSSSSSSSGGGSPAGKGTAKGTGEGKGLGLNGGRCGVGLDGGSLPAATTAGAATAVGPRPIEFRRRVIRPNQATTASEGAGAATVETYPIKVVYTIVGGDRYGDGSNNGNNDHSHNLRSHQPHQPQPQPRPQSQQQQSHGFVLASRQSSARDVLRSVLRAAAPHKSTACKRLWYRPGGGTHVPSEPPALAAPDAGAGTGAKRIGGSSGGARSGTSLGQSATARGDGFDLLDLDALGGNISGDGNGEGNGNKGKASSAAAAAAGAALSSPADKETNKMETTLADWVDLWTDSGGSNTNGRPTTTSSSSSSNSNNYSTMTATVASTSLAAHVLIELRPGPSSPWPRSTLELPSRLRVGDFVDAQDSAGKWYEAIVRSVTDDTVTVHYLGWNSRWDATIRRYPGPKPCGIAGCSRMADAPKPLWSRVRRWRDSVGVGDEVEVREAASLMQRPKWFKAVVRAVGGAEDVVREIVGGADLEVYEDDDYDEDESKSDIGSVVREGNAAAAAGSGSGLGLDAAAEADAAESGSGDSGEVTETPDETKPKQHLLLLKRTRQVLVEVQQERFNTPGPLQPAPFESSTTTAAGAALTASDEPKPQPPYIRWVNLYGEEICARSTHNKWDQDTDNSGRPATLRYAHDPSRPPVEVMKSYGKIHGEGFIRESIRGIPPAPGSVGLQNLGNSCFMNSILQCLNHIEPLTKFFLTGEYMKDMNRRNPLGSGGQVAHAYAALLAEMWGGEFATLAPRLLKQTVANFAPQFNNIYQHDSQEFCSFLMDGIHEDLNRVKEKPYVEELEARGMPDGKAAMESWRKHLLRHDSIIVDHCQGMYRSHLTCPKCGRESVKFDVFSTIPLPLATAKASEGSIPLEDCLEKLTMGEQLDDANAWYCPSCKEHVCALKMIALWSVPDVLILHLKRFTYNHCEKRGGVVRSKIEDKVEFPVDSLDLRKHVLGPWDPEAPPVYNLFGVSEHSGTTANSGHYTANVRNSLDGKWYRYNDSHVGVTSGDASVTGGAYLLFYQRKNGRSRWGGMERAMKETDVDPHGAMDTDVDGFTQVKSKKKKKKKAPSRK